MFIRRETTADVDTVDAIHAAAFEPQAPGETPIEVGLVRALRDDEGWRPELSLVAEDAAGRVVGHNFQARPLATWTEQVRGTFRYARPFDDLR